MASKKQKKAAKGVEKAVKRNPKLWLSLLAFVLIVAIVAGVVWYFAIYKKEGVGGNEPPANSSEGTGSTEGGGSGGSGSTEGDGSGGTGSTEGGGSGGTGSTEGDSGSGGDTIAELDIYFPELGNKYAGDCVLIKTGNTEVLIDAGSRTGSAATIVPYIKNYCTDGVLEYVIATHAHQDHIAAFVGTSSAKGVFESFVCGTIIDFPRTDADSQVYKDYVSKRDAEVAEGAKHYTALECWNETNGAKKSYALGEGIEMTILYQKFYETKSSDENNYSVCLLVTQGESNFLFTGDLEKAGEESLVESNDLPHCKLFKGGHHGSRTSSNDILLSKITPENVCICCCAGSPEYSTDPAAIFPTQEMIDRVAKYTKNIYVTTLATNVTAGSQAGYGYTSMNGNITVRSIGATVTVTGSNNSTILKETAWFKANRTWPSYGVQ